MTGQPAPSPFGALYDSHFVKVAMDASVSVSQSLGDNPVLIEPTQGRLPDEYEFYLLNVGSRLAHLMTVCGHLQAIPIMMGAFRSTPALASAEITRHSHVVFHTEGYLIRVGSLFDWVLKVVDGVFHLGNSERNCSMSVIISNVRVDHYKDVVATLKVVRKLTDRYQADRNAIVHARPYMDQRLRYAELYELLSRSRSLDGDPSAAFLERERNTFLRDFCKEKKDEFQRFNIEIAAALSNLFGALQPRYAEEAQVLKHRLEIKQS
jgi:hypothetical protein